VKKRLCFSMIVILMMVCAMATASAVLANSNDYVAEGTCGQDLVWAITEDGTLMISGNGDMTNFTSASSQPWRAYRNSITCIITGNEVTSIGTYAFQSCSALSEIKMGIGVTDIENYSFQNCAALKTVTFTGDSPHISSKSFSNVKATAYYPIGNATWTASKLAGYGGTITWKSYCAEHKEEIDAAIKPTCIETGLTEGRHCSVCGKVLIAQEELPATGHSYSSGVTAQPSCTEKGVETYTCHCGDSYSEDIPAAGHTLTQVEAKAPTCTESGWESYEYCTVCDHTTFVETPATSHSYSSAVTTQPSCTEKGVKTYTCHCGDTYTEEIPAVGHTLTQVEAEVPTCTESGWEAYETAPSVTTPPTGK